jgi:hypothetical protein
MEAVAGPFLEATSVYLTLGFLSAASFCFWSILSRWHDPHLKDHTREAMIGLLILLVGIAMHFGVAYVLRSLSPGDVLAEFVTVPALVVRTILIAAGLLIVVRAWTYNRCGERGWMWLLVVCLVGGFLVDRLLTRVTG